MRYIEDKFGMPIEELLMSGSLRDIADRLEIALPTVSAWKKKLGLPLRTYSRRKEKVA